MNKLLCAVALAVTLACTSGASAQVYPSRPITIVVPFAAGGPNDTFARILAERMRGSLGQPVLIENIGGAGGVIGVGRVARATGDGYTLSFGSLSSHVLNGGLFNLPYDVVNDFEPIAMAVDGPQLLVGRKTLPANDLKELLAWLKANPDKATLGHPGNGSAAHVAGAFMQKETGTRFTLVPYRGGGPVMQDVVSGQIDLTMTVATNSLPQVRSGLVRPYAVMGKTRLTVAPDIPTVDEAGMPGVYSSVWFALWAPKGTPKDIVGKLNAAVVDALADPGAQARLRDLGQEIPAREQQTPEFLGALHKAEVEKWWPIVKAAGIKPE
jgi:tripartite-type tricarboxylate transporter receptor subunit TctC